MSIDIAEALSNGYERTTKKNGLMMAGLFFVAGLLNNILGQTMAEGLNLQAGETASNTALALPISPAIAGILIIPATLFSIIVGITALRVFTSSETEVIPSEYYRRNIGWTVINIFVGGIAFGLIVALPLIPVLLGFGLFSAGISPVIGLLLVALGILVGLPLMLYLIVSLYLWNVFVVVEDLNFIEGLKNSWNITKGKKMQLFGLGVIVVVITLLISVITGIPLVIGFDVIGELTGQIGSALAQAFTAATIAQVYLQLTES